MTTTDNQEKITNFVNTLQSIYNKELSTSNLAKIEEEFKSKINKMKDKILLKVMGFDYKYGSSNTWEVDHCNGRSGNSPLGDAIRAAAHNAMQNFLLDVNNEHSIHNILENNKNRLGQVIETEFTKHLNYYVKEYITQQVKALAKQKVDALITEAETNSTNVLDFMQTLLEK